MSGEIVVRQAAPTLAGIKTGSLFPYPCRSKKRLLDEIRAFNRRFACCRCGIRTDRRCCTSTGRPRSRAICWMSGRPRF